MKNLHTIITLNSFRDNRFLYLLTSLTHFQNLHDTFPEHLLNNQMYFFRIHWLNCQVLLIEKSVYYKFWVGSVPPTRPIVMIASRVFLVVFIIKSVSILSSNNNILIIVPSANIIVGTFKTITVTRADYFKRNLSFQLHEKSYQSILL